MAMASMFSHVVATSRFLIEVKSTHRRLVRGSHASRPTLGGFKLRTSRRSSKQDLWNFGGIAILIAMLLGTTPWIHAQIATTTATISGTISDSSGAVVPNADVTLISTEAGISRKF